MIRTSRIKLIGIVFGALLLLNSNSYSKNSNFVISSEEQNWQQANSSQSFTAFVEREIYSNLDKVGRFVFAVQIGRKKELELADLSVNWQVDKNSQQLSAGTVSLKKGMASVEFRPDSLSPGEYNFSAVFMSQGKEIKKITSGFLVKKQKSPSQSGKIALIIPSGIAVNKGTYPVSCGVPFPKGALWNKNKVRVLSDSGKSIPCQTIIRSRWGAGKQSSIRWLGVDFQANKSTAWWPEQKQIKYYLEYGSKVSPAKPKVALSVKSGSTGISVNTGVLQFKINPKKFNLLGKVKLNGSRVLGVSDKQGLYLKDHKGNVYRAANDRNVKLKIEENGPLKVVIRADGWYVKDDSTGAKLNWKLPTDKLCKFTCRIEAYAGKSYVRITNSTVLTYDTFSVRLRDLGISLPLANARKAVFGVEDNAPITKTVPSSGVYLLQHLPHEFDIENGNGKKLASGKHSAGYFQAITSKATVTASLREAWQRYPKEFEVTPNALKVHIWPAHGKKHPQIDQLDDKNVHKIMFAHQGREMNLKMPWEYYLTAAKKTDTEAIGVYSSTGQILAGVHSSAMGAAITYDLMFYFSKSEQTKKAANVAACFEQAPMVMANPKWNCATLAAGWVRHYDPEKFEVPEKIIQNLSHGYWKTGNITDEYGMWIYRRWHHSPYLGNGEWDPYRLNNTTHHHEAIMPWLFLFRSGDPFYLTQGNAHMRGMTDVGIIHYDDKTYPHKELHFHQKRLVGSTKHTNAFNTWGGDHGIGGHMTSYDAILLAYYLTGDRSYLDSVDQWHNTLVNDRKNKNYKIADRSTDGKGDIKTRKASARDLGNFIGDLIDLYQYDYDPKVLAMIAPRLNTFVRNHNRHWGMSLHNIAYFHGSRILKKNLLEAIKDYRKHLGKGNKDPHSIWYTHTKYFPSVLAANLNKNDKSYAAEAYAMAELPTKKSWAKMFNTPGKSPVPFCTLPDYAIYLPHLMYACQGADLKAVQSSQPLPIGMRETRCIIKEDKDQDIKVRLSGSSKVGFKLKVFDPQNKEIIDKNIESGVYKPLEIIIPKDEKTGQYTILIKKLLEHKASLKIPLTSLPEVFVTNYWSQFAPAKYFVKPVDGKSFKMSFRPSSRPGTIIDAETNKVLAASKKGEWVDAQIPTHGAWISTVARYIAIKPQIVISVSSDKWFAPDKDKMK